MKNLISFFVLIFILASCNKDKIDIKKNPFALSVNYNGNNVFEEGILGENFIEDQFNFFFSSFSSLDRLPINDFYSYQGAFRFKNSDFTLTIFFNSNIDTSNVTTNEDYLQGDNDVREYLIDNYETLRSFFLKDTLEYRILGASQNEGVTITLLENNSLDIYSTDVDTANDSDSFFKVIRVEPILNPDNQEGTEAIKVYVKFKALLTDSDGNTLRITSDSSRICFLP